jgi:stage II sporulation protein AA (anti-sigma F factor antagonist)
LDAEQLRCEVARDRRDARVRLVGALDLATVAVLEAELAQLREAGARRIVLDLSALDFIDSTGLRCILERDSKARQDGFSIVLVPGPPAVQRVFDITRTTERLPFIDP